MRGEAKKGRRRPAEVVNQLVSVGDMGVGKQVMCACEG